MCHWVFLTIFIVCYLNCGDAEYVNLQSTTFEGVPKNWFNEMDPEPFVKVGNKFYLIEAKKRANWFVAAHICRTYKAQLASIESALEMRDLNDYLYEKNYNASLNNWFWLSANDLGEKDNFYWLGTGKPMTFTKWDQGQPDRGPNERCVNIWFQHGAVHMNDMDCSKDLFYICQASTPKTVAFTIW